MCSCCRNGITRDYSVERSALTGPGSSGHEQCSPSDLALPRLCSATRPDQQVLCHVQRIVNSAITSYTEHNVFSPLMWPPCSKEPYSLLLTTILFAGSTSCSVSERNGVSLKLNHTSGQCSHHNRRSKYHDLPRQKVSLLVLYFRDLETPTQSLNAILLKFARVSTGAGGEKVYSLKRTA